MILVIRQSVNPSASSSSAVSGSDVAFPQVTGLLAAAQMGLQSLCKTWPEQQECQGQAHSSYVSAQIRWRISSLRGADEEKMSQKEGKIPAKDTEPGRLAKEVIAALAGRR